MEVVIALLMYLNDPPVLKEHLLMPSISECLKKKRIAILGDSMTENAQLNNERDNLMPERGTLSNQKSINFLGYKSKFPIEKGYLQYIKWYKEFWGNHKKN